MYQARTLRSAVRDANTTASADRHREDARKNPASMRLRRVPRSLTPSREKVAPQPSSAGRRGRGASPLPSAIDPWADRARITSSRWSAAFEAAVLGFDVGLRVARRQLAFQVQGKVTHELIREPAPILVGADRFVHRDPSPASSRHQMDASTGRRVVDGRCVR